MTIMVEKRNPKTVKPEVFCCGFCKREFKREKTLSSHKCAQKEKFLARDTKEGKVALDIWVRFRKFYRIPIKKADSLYDAFAESKEFQSFYDFAKYIIEAQIIKTDEFIDYLFRNGIPQKQWDTQTLKKQWILHITRDEHPDTAITRSIHTLEEWALNTGNNMNDFFSLVSPQRFMMLVDSGKLSAWFIHAASTRQALLDRLTDEEFGYIYDYIDPAIWNVKKLRYKEQYDRYCEVLKGISL